MKNMTTQALIGTYKYMLTCPAIPRGHILEGQGKWESFLDEVREELMKRGGVNVNNH